MSVLGNLARDGTRDDDVEWVWVDDLFYVRALTHIDDDDYITRFAVTTRWKRFRPILRVAGMKCQLGRTTFEEGVLTGIPLVQVDIRAHRGVVAQRAYLANPGDYQTLIVAANDAGHLARDDSIGSLL